MQSLPANIYSVASVREIDRTAIEDHGIPGYTLMGRAGAASAEVARRCFPQAQRWQVICGPGNNGGDGYVVARLAAQDGIDVSVVTLVDPESLKGDAATAYRDFTAQGGVVSRWTGELDNEAQLLVDAVFGSGLEREVSGDFADAVAAINEHAANVVALDIPSGIHGDSGNELGCAVHADVTVTFVGLKKGLFLSAGAEVRGELVYDGLAIPDECRTGVSAALSRIDETLLHAALPRRSKVAHKGNFGHVLIIGGGEGMPGAVRLCGEAALRTGAGLVSIATAPSHASIVAATRPELMSHAIADVDDLEPLLEKADVVAFGPGLGQSDWANVLFERVMADTHPSVWDADALNLLATNPGSSDNRIITPHPGEAARLLELSVKEIQGDRTSAVNALQKRYGGVSVLKGAGSLIASAGEVPALCTSGNPGMAAAGMGDVLTGVIAALLAQGASLSQAAQVGVEVHARAGDIAAASGERGLIASDLIDALRTVVNP